MSAILPEERLNFVGASELGALIDEDNFKTRYQLWHEKNRTLPVEDLSSNQAVQRGVYLESAVANWLADTNGYVIEKVTKHFSEDKLGASLDYIITNDSRGNGALEIKTTALRDSDKWSCYDDLPLKFQLQHQAQMGLAGCSWGVIGVLTGGLKLLSFECDFRPSVYEKVKALVASFWKSIELGEEPAYTDADIKTRMTLLQDFVPEKAVDFSDDAAIAEIVSAYAKFERDEKIAAQGKELTKLAILEVMGDSERMVCGDFSVKRVSVAAKPDSFITQEMVGQVIKGRAGHSKFLFKRQNGVNDNG